MLKKILKTVLLMGILMSFTGCDAILEAMYPELTEKSEPPMASIYAKTKYAAKNTPVKLEGEKSFDFDGWVVRWEWDFQDGQKSYEKNPEHIFANAGSYYVTLTVTDNDGNRDTQVVIIEIVDSIDPNQKSIQLQVDVGESLNVFDAPFIVAIREVRADGTLGYLEMHDFHRLNSFVADFRNFPPGHYLIGVWQDQNGNNQPDPYEPGQLFLNNTFTTTLRGAAHDLTVNSFSDALFINDWDRFPQFYFDYQAQIPEVDYISEGAKHAPVNIPLNTNYQGEVAPLVESYYSIQMDIGKNYHVVLRPITSDVGMKVHQNSYSSLDNAVFVREDRQFGLSEEHVEFKADNNWMIIEVKGNADGGYFELFVEEKTAILNSDGSFFAPKILTLNTRTEGTVLFDDFSYYVVQGVPDGHVYSVNVNNMSHGVDLLGVYTDPGFADPYSYNLEYTSMMEYNLIDEKVEFVIPSGSGPSNLYIKVQNDDYQNDARYNIQVLDLGPVGSGNIEEPVDLYQVYFNPFQSPGYVNPYDSYPDTDPVKGVVYVIDRDLLGANSPVNVEVRSASYDLLNVSISTTSVLGDPPTPVHSGDVNYNIIYSHNFADAPLQRYVYVVVTNLSSTSGKDFEIELW